MEVENNKLLLNGLCPVLAQMNFIQIKYSYLQCYQLKKLNILISQFFLKHVKSRGKKQKYHYVTYWLLPNKKKTCTPYDT